MERKNERFLIQVHFIFDALFVFAVFFLAWWLKFESGWIPYETPIAFQVYLLYSMIYVGIVVGVGYITKLYSSKRKKSFAYEQWKVIQVHSISIFILLSLLYVIKEVDVSRSLLAIYYGLGIAFVSGYRYGAKIILRSLREKGYNKQFVLILGAGSLGRSFYKNLIRHPELGYEVVGFLDDNITDHEQPFTYYKPILGRIDQLSDILNQEVVDEVIIALPLDVHYKYAEILEVCEKAGVKTMIIPDFFDILPAKPSFDNFAGIPLINVRNIPLDDLGNRLLKRAFDIGFSSAVLILTSPLLLLIAIGIKLTSPGPIFFKQERLGLNRRSFTIYKFRTMRVSTAQVSDTTWTTEADDRRTRLGTFLRQTSLDEFPQFFNVLRGDMSVVGPRPERPYFAHQFKEDIPKYMVKHQVRPGLTGWAQSNGLRGDTSIADRIQYDLFYIENWTFLFDIKIIVMTILKGFVNKNAY